MPVYCSDQYTSDFSPYLRHIFAVKHIYLTLYIVRMRRIAPIYSVPACSRARARTAVVPPARSLPADRRTCGRVTVPAPVCARPRACVGARACGRVCAWARAWPRLLPLFASFYSPIMYILRRYARPARRVVRSAHSAANFFEIVFGQSISVQLSSAGMGDAS